MNKLFTKIGVAMVGLAMAVGVGVAANNNAYREAKAADKTDVMNYTWTDIGGTGYSPWTKTGSSTGITYKGNSGGTNSAIQLRVNATTSGIVSTTTIGTLKTVTVTWNSNTANGRTLNIYGSNTAYTAVSDMAADSKTIGTKIGTIVKGTSTTLDCSGTPYKYVGLVSNSGAMFLDEINVTWTESTDPSVTISQSDFKLYTTSEDYQLTATTKNPSDATVSWSSSNESVATVSSTGLVHPVAAGVATITAKITVAGKDYTDTVKATIRVLNNMTFQKVTSSLTDWTGKYLIVYEGATTTAVFNSDATELDAPSNYVEGTIVTNSITISDEYSVTIAPVDGGYSIKSFSGLYIGHTGSSNALSTSETNDFVNSISYDGGVKIKCNSSYYLKFNASEGQMRFRFINSSGTIALYRETFAHEINDFSSKFVAAMATPCADQNADNKTAVSAIWGTWKATFEALNTSTKALFVESSGDATVVRAVKLYKHCVSRYSLSAWTDAPAVASLNNDVNGFKTNSNNNAALVIIIIASVSLVTIAGYFVIRRRKEK